MVSVNGASRCGKESIFYGFSDVEFWLALLHFKDRK